MTHADLVNVAANWADNKHGVVLSEFHCSHYEICDVIAFAGRDSTMIECKASRADFLRDKYKLSRRLPEYSMGNYRYYCCPKGLIKPEEMPEGWGLLEVNNSKARQRNGLGSKRFKLTLYGMQAERRILYSFARRVFAQGLATKVLEPIGLLV